MCLLVASLTQDPLFSKYTQEVRYFLFKGLMALLQDLSVTNQRAVMSNCVLLVDFRLSLVKNLIFSITNSIITLCKSRS